jgi:hypothetical protein
LVRTGVGVTSNIFHQDLVGANPRPLGRSAYSLVIRPAVGIGGIMGINGRREGEMFWGVVREAPRGEKVLGGQRASRHFNGGAELLVRPKMLSSRSFSAVSG